MHSTQCQSSSFEISSKKLDWQARKLQGRRLQPATHVSSTAGWRQQREKTKKEKEKTLTNFTHNRLPERDLTDSREAT